ncbi:MAG: SPFH domain-containing protein [Acutalibacteraceae bacterium]
MAILEVIKYEGDNHTFVWKHPAEDFSTQSQLIVHQSQEAIFYANGQALDLFGPGRYTLQTQVIPLIRRLFNLPFGGESPFHAEVYFINKTEQMAIKWGTDSKVEYIEPTYQFPVKIGASGEMSLRIQDARKLLVKIVGTESVLGQEKLVANFRAFLTMRIKTYLASTIKERKISIFEIDEHLTELSDTLKNQLDTDFDDYGVALEKFMVTTILKPDGEPGYERIKQLHLRQYADVTEAQLRQKIGVIDQTTEAQKTIIEAQGIAQKRQIEGYTYQQERAYDVAEKIGENEGIGNFSSAGIGIGMMAGIATPVGGVVGGVLNDALSPISPQKAGDGAVNPEAGAGGLFVDPAAVSAQEGGLGTAGEAENTPAVAAFCENCGAALDPGSSFCEECGEAVAAKPACSKCGFTFIKPGKFCPKCGTKRV